MKRLILFALVCAAFAFAGCSSSSDTPTGNVTVSGANA